MKTLSGRLAQAKGKKLLKGPCTVLLQSNRVNVDTHDKDPSGLSWPNRVRYQCYLERLAKCGVEPGLYQERVRTGTQVQAALKARFNRVKSSEKSHDIRCVQANRQVVR